MGASGGHFDCANEHNTPSPPQTHSFLLYDEKFMMRFLYRPCETQRDAAPDGQCQTGDMDMDAAIKVRKEPQGKAGVGPGQRAKDRYPMRQMRARTSAMEIID
ncbi:hypothetical protein NQZ68_020287 [Dissostichus eleginoides]|nr:hypothetical protein NQZ68_020287 [Dissostichus eleginoides]